MHESSKAHSSSRPFFEADGRAGSARKGGNETQQAPGPKESSPMSPNANPSKSAGHRTMARLKLEHERALDEYADYLPRALAPALAQPLAPAPTPTLTPSPNPNPNPNPNPDPHQVRQGDEHLDRLQVRADRRGDPRGDGGAPRYRGDIGEI